MYLPAFRQSAILKHFWPKLHYSVAEIVLLGIEKKCDFLPKIRFESGHSFRLDKNCFFYYGMEKNVTYMTVLLLKNCYGGIFYMKTPNLRLLLGFVCSEKYKGHSSHIK